VRVVLAGGGTGGHVTPALAVAEGLKARLGDGVDIAYVGTAHGVERDLVPRTGLPFHVVHARGLLKRRWVDRLEGVTATARGVVEAWRLLGRLRPDVVVGTGGYVTGPVGLAAVWRHIPLVLQEQNVWPGLTNRLLARRARVVMVAWADTARHLPPGSRIRVAGNPVRPSLLAVDRAAARERFGVEPGSVLVVATGGSQGAPAINRLMASAWPELARRSDVHCRWATGPGHYRSVVEQLAPPPDGQRLVVEPYLYDMDWVLAAADVAVGRAGAMTCTETLARGVAALLVPSPHVPEHTQERNAAYLADAGAALALPEDQVDENGAALLLQLVNDGGRRMAMAEAGRRLFRADALERIVDAVVEAAQAN
jgi:UDP-N-acetylglucosamine--N-acetylmuramyl-(pentapeptide) pyrophosphoryl-undecaprenol N-acetylglucosamine transferase